MRRYALDTKFKSENQLFLRRELGHMASFLYTWLSHVTIDVQASAKVSLWLEHSSVHYQSAFKPQHMLMLKGRVWSKIMFCVWLAFAVKIVVVRTAELNLAWFTRYEPRKPQSDDVTCHLHHSAARYVYLAVRLPKVFSTA